MHYQRYWKGRLGSYQPKGRRRHRDYEAKLGKFVSRNHETGCWEWTGARFPDGYGLVKDKGENRGAHRWVYEHEVGSIPEGRELDHLCRVRHCVNPEHLEPVVSQENHRRGLLPYTIRTKCRKGLHDITKPEAWYVQPSTEKRTCRECRLASQRRASARYRARLKAA